MKKLLILALLITGTLALSACETAKGIGRDMQYVGDVISGR